MTNCMILILIMMDMTDEDEDTVFFQTTCTFFKRVK